ncbi:MAG: hypothetical protein QM817_09820 [Archangium sp.]
MRLLALVVLLSSFARADNPSEALRVDPPAISDSVWRQSIGYAFLNGGKDDVLRSTRGRTFTLGIVRGVSEDGDGLRRVAVLTVREDFVQIVSDPERNMTLWVERKALDSLTLWEQLKPQCCVQLLHLAGAERVEARALPRDDSKVVRAFNPPSAPLEILEVRGEWMKVGNQNTGDETFVSNPGWIRLRDGRGRLVFWFVQPDNC